MRVVFGECEFDSGRAGAAPPRQRARRFLPGPSSSWSCFSIGALRPWRRRSSSSVCGRRRSSPTRACTTWSRRSGPRSATHHGRRGTSGPFRDTATRFTATRGRPRHSTPSQRSAQARASSPRSGEWLLAEGANWLAATRIVPSASTPPPLAQPRPDCRDACGDDDRGPGQQERNTGERRASHASRAAQRQRPDPGRLRRDDLSHRGHASIHAYPAAGVRQQRMTSRVELDVNVRQPKWMDDPRPIRSLSGTRSELTTAMSRSRQGRLNRKRNVQQTQLAARQW